MSITEKKNGRRVWSDSFISEYKILSSEDRYLNLILGLSEAGFVKQDYTSYSPLSRVTDMHLEGIVVRLYLVELNNELVICYRVGIEGQMDNDDTDTIFRLNFDTIWDDIRRSWVRLKL
jgi:hypothetical protein